MQRDKFHTSFATKARKEKFISIVANKRELFCAKICCWGVARLSAGCSQILFFIYWRSFIRKSSKNWSTLIDVSTSAINFEHMFSFVKMDSLKWSPFDIFFCYLWTINGWQDILMLDIKLGLFNFLVAFLSFNRPTIN